MSEVTENQVEVAQGEVVDNTPPEPQLEVAQDEVVDNTPPEPQLGAYGLPIDEHVYVLSGSTKREAISAFESLAPTISAFVQADGNKFVLITREVFTIDGVKILEQIQ
jgi:hypothetical protein